MSQIPSDISAPGRFVSAGLRKLLLRHELVSEHEFDRIARISGNQKAIAALDAKGLCDEKEVLQKVADSLAIALVHSEYGTEPWGHVESSILDKCESTFALRHRFFPVRQDGGQLLVALADPLDAESLSDIEFVVGCPVKVSIASEAEIIVKIREHLSEEAIDFDEILELTEDGESVEVMVFQPKGNEGKADSVSAPPVVRLVNKILADAAAANASDIHLEPTAKHLEVRFRIDGMMRGHLSLPKRLQSYVLSRVKLLSEMDITEKRRPQDGRFRMRTGRRSTRDVRVSSVPTPFGEKLVLRLLRSDLEDMTFDAVGMPKEVQEKFESELSGSERIVIVTGPTGSGKSTTLYTALNYLQRGTNTIVTVEDPIEFRVEGITQIQVDPKVGVTFASGLRSILRQDPDVILVGEVRDLETAEMAFQAAQTGHMVLTTLHTNDAPSAVVRLLDLGLEPFVVASSLSSVLAQRLVRTICPNCKTKLEPSQCETIRDTYGIETDKLAHGVGCLECDQTGYQGRIGLFSLLPVNQKIRELIRNGASEAELNAEAKQFGMKELFEAGLEVVRQGLSTIVEVERVVGTIKKANPNEKPLVQEAPEKVTFSPAPIEQEDSSESVASLAKVAPTNGSNGLAKILVIDDDRGVRSVMSKALKRADFDVVEAVNGEDATEKLKLFVPDAIVCDLDMPKLNGYDFLKHLRADSKASSVPILMLSGMDSEESEMNLIDAGANDFVSKSASPQLVVTRVKRLLG